MSPTLLVLAAGMGSRFGGLKQMAPLGPHGETLLDYSVFDAYRAGFGSVVFVIRQDFKNEFKSSVGSRFTSFMPVTYAYQAVNDLPEGLTPPAERSKPWGTGHAVLSARRSVQNNFCVINADDFYGREAYARMAAFLKSAPSDKSTELRACMVGYRLRQTLSSHGSVSRGICQVGKTGELISVQEMTRLFPTLGGAENRIENQKPIPLTGQEIVSLNFWGFTPGIFAELQALFQEFVLDNLTNNTSEFYLPFAIDTLIAKHTVRVEVLSTESPWFGVTYREDSPVVQQALLRLIQAGEYPETLF